jgi:hypothetical protein
MHQQLIADGYTVDRHFLDAALGAAMRLAWGAIDQCAQIMLGTGDRDVFEHVATGIHQRHDGAGQGLTKCEGCAHRYQRNRIDAEPSAQEVPDDRDRQSHHHGYGRKRPAEISEVRAAGEIRNNPC